MIPALASLGLSAATTRRSATKASQHNTAAPRSLRYGLLVLAVATCVGCSSRTFPAGGSGGHSPNQARCSNPNPNPAEVTFAEVVCVQEEVTVPQSDGSQELKLRLHVTNKDPNDTSIALRDFKLVDPSGNAIAVDFAGVAGNLRTNAADCSRQSDDLSAGFQLAVGQSMDIPDSVCFNLSARTRLRQLVLNDDIPVNLS